MQELKSKPVINKQFNTTTYSIAILVSRWHNDITDNLLEGALNQLTQAGMMRKDIKVFYVPGSFELPLGAKWLLDDLSYDLVICLGCIIKGETDHYNHIATATTNAIMLLNMEYSKPVIYGVLTTNTLAQAKARSGKNNRNKGREAAMAAIDMLNLYSQLRPSSA